MAMGNDKTAKVGYGSDDNSRLRLMITLYDQRTNTSAGCFALRIECHKLYLFTSIEVTLWNTEIAKQVTIQIFFFC